MKTLYESLLDDFDTLANKQEKTLKDPFAYLFYNSVTSKNWGRALREFEEVIKLDSKEDHKNIKDYYGLLQKNPIKKGQVQVWMAGGSISQLKNDRVVLLFSDADLKPMRDEGCISEDTYNITIYSSLGTLINGRPDISVSAGLPSIDRVSTRYILSKEFSKSAINMVKLIAKQEWRNYWEKL